MHRCIAVREAYRVAARGLVRAGLGTVKENEDDGLPRIWDPPPSPDGIVGAALA